MICLFLISVIVNAILFHLSGKCLFMCTFDKETFLLSIFGVHSFHKFDIFQVPLSFSFPKKALPLSYVVTTRIVGYSFSSLLLEVFDIITHNYASHFQDANGLGGGGVNTHIRG